jgi:AcrR family transcriptional regulator
MRGDIEVPDSVQEPPAGREGSRRRLAPEVRRAEVLEAALQVFTELGYERATLQDVADRAGVTKGALYHYFDSKTELFLELMRERVKAHVAERHAIVAAADPHAERAVLLRELLHAIWSSLQRPGMLALTQLMMAELPKFPEIARTFIAELVMPARRTMQQVWARDGADAGKEELIEVLVTALPSMLLGVALNRHLFSEIDPAVSAARAGPVVVDVLTRGALASVEQHGASPP